MAESCKQMILKIHLFKLRSLARHIEKFSHRTYCKSSENEKTKELTHTDKSVEENAILFEKYLKENPVPNPVRNTEKEYFDSLKDPKRRGLFEKLTPALTSLLYKDYVIDDDTEVLLRNEAKKRQLLREDQRYRMDRVNALGHELAAAHFIVYRGGAVKFVGRDTWYVKGQLGSNPLPNTFLEHIYVEAIDLSNSQVTHAAAENLTHLSHLRYIRMHNCPYLDDWFLAQLHCLKNTLEFLDINNCPDITDNGLSCLHHLSHLQCLKVSNLAGVKHLGLMCLLLEEKIPDLIVLGLKDDQLKPDASQSLGERRLVRALLGMVNENEDDFTKGSIREKYENHSYLKEMFGIVKKID